MYQNCQTCQIVFIFKTNVVHNNCPSPLDETESLFHSFINQHLRSYSNSMLVMYRHVFTSVSIFRKGMERQKFFSTSSLPRYIKIDLIITVIEIPQAVNSVLIEKSSRSHNDQSLVLLKRTLLEESNKSFLNIPSSYKIWQPPLGGDTRWS